MPASASALTGQSFALGNSKRASQTIPHTKKGSIQYAPHLVWSYLAYYCYDQAAMAFLDQWRVFGEKPALITSTEDGSSTSADAAMMEVDGVSGVDTPQSPQYHTRRRSNTSAVSMADAPAHQSNDIDRLLETPLWTTLIHRKLLMQLIVQGHTAEALDYLKKYFGDLFGSETGGGDGDKCKGVHAMTPTIFKIQCQHFVELIREGQSEQALAWVMETLAPITRQQQPIDALASNFFESTLTEVVQLLAYKTPATCPVAYLLAQQRRDELAWELNSTIIEWNQRTTRTDVPVIIDATKNACTITQRHLLTHPTSPLELATRQALYLDTRLEGSTKGERPFSGVGGSNRSLRQILFSS